MTSPEKKKFKLQLFQKDDEMTEKVNITLDNAAVANDKCITTVDESKKVVKDYDDAKQEFNEQMEQIIETNFRSQAAKYKGAPNFVEPNLTKRIEAKREKARLRALVNASEQYSDIASIMSQSNTDKMYQSLTCGVKLERVNEEPAEKGHKSFKITG